jgi:ABC-type uncharacterized transport system permease subunit
MTKGKIYGAFAGLLIGFLALLLLRYVGVSRVTTSIAIAFVATITFVSVAQRIDPPHNPSRGRYRWSKERRENR